MFGRRKHVREDASNGGRWRRRGKAGRERAQARENGSWEAFADLWGAFSNIARGQVFYFADRYRNQAAQLVDDFAMSLRDTEARRDPEEGRSPLIDDIADDLEHVSDLIRDIRLSSALGEIEHLARRKPLVFGLGAIAAGYLITRVAGRGGGRNGYARGGRRGRL